MKSTTFTNVALSNLLRKTKEKSREKISQLSESLGEIFGLSKSRVMVILFSGTALGAFSQEDGRVHGINELGIHRVTDSSFDANNDGQPDDPGDNEAKFLAQDTYTLYALRTDSRLANRNIVPVTKREHTNQLTGGANGAGPGNDRAQFIGWFGNINGNSDCSDCTADDVQFIYTNNGSYAEGAGGQPRSTDGLTIAAFNGAYDNKKAGTHAFGHATGANPADHSGGRYNVLHTQTNNDNGDVYPDLPDGRTNGTDQAGNLLALTTPEAYNVHLVPNGGTGTYSYKFNEGGTNWTHDIDATTMHNENNLDVTTGINQHFINWPNQLKFVAAVAEEPPVLVKNTATGKWDLANGNDYPGYALTKDTNFSSNPDFRIKEYDLYGYQAGTTGNNTFTDGPFKLDEGIDGSTLSCNPCQFRVYDHTANKNGNIGAPITLDTESHEIAGLGMKLFPNPAGNEISMKISDNQTIKEFYVFDSLGRIMNVQSQSISSSEEKLDVSNLASGNYFVMTKGINNGSETKQFIKE